MNKKLKKQWEALRKKVQKLEQLLAAAKQQNDDPSDIPRLQAEIEQVRRQMAELKDK